jgi:anthranilate synthase/aminodeoxychorismate synthase-like glutamine amidotransferase
VPGVHVLLIDNTDSFTWNLAQQIRALGAECTVVGNNDISLRAIKKMKPDRVVISPGPGGPKNSGISLAIIRKLYRTVPILGVCLGHQCIGYVFGGKKNIVHAPTLMHGKTSEIFHLHSSIFSRIPSPFGAARYHSLIVKALSKDFELLAWASAGRKELIMAMKHRKYPLFGVQFHPESFLTEHGTTLMKNFLMGIW